MKTEKEEHPSKQLATFRETDVGRRAILFGELARLPIF